jgi:hypothetical protein
MIKHCIISMQNRREERKRERNRKEQERIEENRGE